MLTYYYPLQLLSDDVLKAYCVNLENTLKHDMLSDIDGSDLFSELRILKEIFQSEKNTPLDVVNYLGKNDSFPNAYVAYRILLMIPITVASAEKKSFLKLKLIKKYLRSTMLQERLNGLAMLYIEKNIQAKLEYNNLINNFASHKARKNDFKYMNFY